MIHPARVRRSLSLVASLALVAAAALPPSALAAVSDPDPAWVARTVASLQASEYRLSAVGADGVFSAPNRAARLRTTWDDGIVLYAPRQGADEWRFTWTLTGVGRGTELAPAPRVAASRVDGTRLEWDRGSLVEWYVNDVRGVEQGFTLASSPRGCATQPLVLEGEIAGLSPVVSADGQMVMLRTAAGEEVMHLQHLVVNDARGADVAARFEAAPGRLRLVVEDEGAVYPLVVDPLAVMPAWQGDGDQINANYGYSVAGIGDVNGDGFGDVAIGARLWDNGLSDEGAVFVYHGSAGDLGADGTPGNADWFAEGDQKGADLGFSVAGAGDVNGDGFDDLLVGADFWDNGHVDEGGAFVYLGSGTGLTPAVVPAATPPSPGSAAWRAESNQPGARLGFSVRGAGDVNGDTYSDIVIGSPFYKVNIGGVLVSAGAAFSWVGGPLGVNIGVFGTPANAPWAVYSDQNSAQLGYAVASAGDVSGAGFDGVIVGANLYDNVESNEGRVYHYPGSAMGLSATSNWRAESNLAFAQFGASVSGGCDVQDDGFDDIVIGAPVYTNGHTQEGIAVVYYGSGTGLNLGVNGVVNLAAPGPDAQDWAAESNQAFANFGISVDMGHFDCASYCDVLVGGNNWDNGQSNEGVAAMWEGDAAGVNMGVNGQLQNAAPPANAPDWRVESNQSLAQLGFSVRSAGDVNGDFAEEALVGVPFFDAGQLDEGRVYLHLGSTLGADTDGDTIPDVCDPCPSCADVGPPSITCPGDITVQCGPLATDPANTGTPTTMDECAGVLTAYVDDPVVNDVCPNPLQVITRTWTATDVCGNTSTCVQTITVLDTTPPTITVCPAATSVECGNDTSPAATGTATATDTCDAMVDVTHSDGPIAGSCPYTFDRTWTATDDCGNTTTCLQTITIRDTQLPTITCPANTWVECATPQPVPDPLVTGSATATDVCDTDVGITFSDVTVPQACASNVTAVITRTWTATDDCGNTSTCNQLIEVRDTTAPVLTCPANVTVECDVDVSGTVNTGGPATATDACDASVTPTFVDNSLGTCPTVVTRTWTAVDDCGNMTTCNQIITRRDTTSPVIAVCVPDTTVSCDAGAHDPANTGGPPLATDNCDLSPAVTHADSCVPVSSDLVAWWRGESDLTDSAGDHDGTPRGSVPFGPGRVGMGYFTGTADFVAPDDPAFELGTDWTLDAWVFPFGLPNAVNAVMAKNGSPATTGVLLAVNSDGSVGVAFHDGVTPYAATTAPGLVVPGAWTHIAGVRSGGLIGVYVNGVLAALAASSVAPAPDSGLPFVVGSEDTVPGRRFVGFIDEASVWSRLLSASEVAAIAAGGPAGLGKCVAACADTFTFTRTWTATDDCGNTTTCAQVVTVQDTTDPMLTAPAATTVECGNPTDPAATGQGTATDDCDPDVLVEYSDANVAGCANGLSAITRTWTATDRCGNSTSSDQTITIVDTTDPVITCPMNVTLECGSPYTPAQTGSATATDTCDPSVVPTFSDAAPVPGGCAGEQTITRTWTATDDCLNSTTCAQVITFVDTTPPSITTCPGPATVTCAVDYTDPANTGGNPTGTDCSGVVNVSHLDSAYGDCCVGFAFTRTFTLQDACGNSTTCAQTITVQPTPDVEVTKSVESQALGAVLTRTVVNTVDVNSTNAGTDNFILSSLDVRCTRLNYLVTVSNICGATATGVVATDTLPTGSTLVDNPDGGDASVAGFLTWTIGSIPGNSSVQRRFSVEVCPGP